MIRNFLKKSIRNFAVKTLNMEFDVEPRKEQDLTRPEFKDSYIPKVVDGSGDTPGPNHKTKIGRPWVSAQLLAGVEPCFIDIRPPNEVISGILPKAHILPGRSIEAHLHILPEKSERVVVYDQTGELGSEQVAAWLREQGWTWARHLDGGYVEWMEFGETIQTVPTLEGSYQIGDSIRLNPDTDGIIFAVLSDSLQLWNEQNGYLGEYSIADI